MHKLALVVAGLLVIALAAPGCDPAETAVTRSAPSLTLDLRETMDATRFWNEDANIERACFGPLGRLGRCLLACNHWTFDGQTWAHGGPLPCRFACVDLQTDEVMSCGHYCSAADCWLAHFDSDLIIYAGEPIPLPLVDAIENPDPYADVPIASSWYGIAQP
jgi:hypothetical protein